MKNLFLSLILLLGFNQLYSQTRVTCIGNSITYGSGIANRDKNSYPSQLQFMLGKDYTVFNFGVSGTSVIKNGYLPYTATYEYMQALKSQPNIVFMKLGTNDSGIRNRHLIASDFKEDYRTIIRKFKQLPSNPRIVLLLPVTSFLLDTIQQSTDNHISRLIIPKIQELAYEEECEIIDLHSLTIDASDMFPDKLHPSSLGAREIARRLYESVIQEGIAGINLKNTKFENVEESNFYGFQKINFIFNEKPCKIVAPKKAVKGYPWIWRARFWGHEPQADIALLERGFHLVYCDVSEMFGNKKSIEIWNNYYDELISMGLSEKVVLEGMSRGGIYVYNWAVENPDKVACIYADAPVLDMRSWPGGKFEGKGSLSDWGLYKEQYGFKSDKQALSYKGNPIFKTKQIAKGGYPLLHIVGDLDDVVPVNENTALFEKKILKEGGNIRVIHKSDVGHHPHSLPNPTEIVKFILEATNNKLNFTTIPTPGVEYRSAAGWINWADWWSNVYDIQQGLDTCKNADVLFLGNSITQGLGKRGLVTHRPGEKAFTDALRGYRWYPAGISGDRSENILWRVINLNYDEINPKYTVITIGVNNMLYDSSKEIIQGISAVVESVKKKIPNTKIILLGPLPCGIESQGMRRKQYEEVHKGISSLHGEQVIYCNLSTSFIKSDGMLNSEYISQDGIHFTSEGYRVWAEKIVSIIETLGDISDKQSS